MTKTKEYETWQDGANELGTLPTARDCLEAIMEDKTIKHADSDTMFLIGGEYAGGQLFKIVDATKDRPFEISPNEGTKIVQDTYESFTGVEFVAFKSGGEQYAIAISSYEKLQDALQRELKRDDILENGGFRVNVKQSLRHLPSHRGWLELAKITNHAEAFRFLENYVASIGNRNEGRGYSAVMQFSVPTDQPYTAHPVHIEAYHGQTYVDPYLGGRAFFLR